MDWKLENKKSRYIDGITWAEGVVIAFLAAGKPDGFELTELKADCNGNNIPHVELHYRCFEPMICDGTENYVGIFHNLNTYVGRSFHQASCQKELFEHYKTFGFE